MAATATSSTTPVLKKKELDDRLSDLHDSVLLHLLSFLPTNQVVKTCILSKRWRSVWASISDLNFHLTELRNGDFVDQVLAHRVGSNLRRFSLTTPGNLDFDDRVSNWILYAMTHDVRQLKVDLGSKIRLTKLNSDATHRIFMCQSLESLQLVGLYLDLPELSTHIHLSKLRVLHLNYISGNRSNWLGKLISNCLILEELVLFGHLNVFNISSPNLKTLRLCTLDISEIWVSCPRLQMFHLLAIRPLRCFHGVVPSLVEAVVAVPIKKYQNAVIVGELLQSFKNVSYFRFLHGLYPQHLWEEPDKPMPTFLNLKRLILNVCLHTDMIEALITLLKHSPNLNFLSIRGEALCGCGDKGESWMSRKLPSKILDHLKCVEIWNYDGCKVGNKGEFVKFLSLNARALIGVNKRIKSPSLPASANQISSEIFRMN